jgi:hypothetical protein
MDFLEQLGTNKIAIGICLFTLNVAARNIYLELSANQTRLLENDMVKRFILFSLFFVGTRDAVVALALTLIVSVFIFGFLHEDSKINLVSCMLPANQMQSSQQHQYNNKNNTYM